MPKVSTEEADSPKKRAPRKRAVRRTISDDDSPAPRRRTVTASTVTTTSAVRKAPTRIEYTENKKTSRKSGMVVIVILLFVIGGATWLGISDKGQINVNAKINEKNQKQADEANANSVDGAPQTIVVPVQNSAPTVPNGGFRGRGVGSADIVSEPVVDENASSTQEVEGQEATSTEPVNEEIAVIPSENEPQPEAEATESGTPELAQ